MNDVVFSKDQIISLGLFMESLKSMPKILLDYELCNAFIEHYSCLTEEFQNHLKNYTRICINKSLIRIAKRRQLSPFILHNCIDIPFGRGGLSEWIEDSTKSEVIRIVNFKFSNLNDLEELKDAYKYGFISREQYYNKFQKLVSGYNLYQLTELLDDRILDNYGGVNKSTPLAIQWYVASRIIKYFDIKPQKPFKYVKLKYDVISDIRSLLNWFSKKNLDKRTLSKLEQRLFLVLDNKEKWSLFEEGFVSTPGEDNIRKRLNKAYENFSLDDRMFKKECFQTVMYKDLQTIDNPDLKLFIIDHLNSIYQQKAIMSFRTDNKR